MKPDPAPKRPAAAFAEASAPKDLPAWFPAWASQLADLYFSGTTAAFVLHGNTYDLIPLGDVDAASRAEFGTIPEFLAEQLFGRWDLVLHYDLGRGLRVFAGRNEKRLKEMVAYTAEFSSVAEACIRKHAPSSVVASVFEKGRP